MAEKGIPGKPKYQRGDKVRFSYRKRDSEALEYLNGEVWIVDSYGTFFNDSEPSYDIYAVNEDWPDGCLFKHIPESRVDPGNLVQ